MSHSFFPNSKLLLDGSQSSRLLLIFLTLQIPIPKHACINMYQIWDILFVYLQLEVLHVYEIHYRLSLRVLSLLMAATNLTNFQLYQYSNNQIVTCIENTTGKWVVLAGIKYSLLFCHFLYLNVTCFNNKIKILHTVTFASDSVSADPASTIWTIGDMLA